MQPVLGVLYAVPSTGRSRAGQVPALFLLVSVQAGLFSSSLHTQCDVQRWNVIRGDPGNMIVTEISSPGILLTASPGEEAAGGAL